MTVLGCGLPLRPGQELKDDLGAVVSSVFTNAYVDSTPGAATLHDFVQTAQSTARIQQVAAKVKGDNGATVTAALKIAGLDDPTTPLDLSTGTAAATVTLTNTAAAIPMTVSNLRLDPSGTIGMSVTGLAASYDLAPRQSLPIPVTLHWPVPSAKSLGGDPVDRAGGLRLSGTVGSPWTKAITEKVDNTFTTKTALAPVALSIAGHEAGTVDTMQIALIVLIVLALAALGVVAWRLAPAPLAGRLEVEANGATHTYDLTGRHQKLGTVSLGGAEATIRLRGPIRDRGQGGAGVQCRPSERARGRKSGFCPRNDVLILTGRWQFRHLPD
ncbi:hypothetical protein ACFQ9X_12110 [Catenulispora yoronensis]